MSADFYFSIGHLVSGVDIEGGFDIKSLQFSFLRIFFLFETGMYGRTKFYFQEK